MINRHLKGEIGAYWSKRAEAFDQQVGHRIVAPAWSALFEKGLGDLARKNVLDLACGTSEINRTLLAMGAEVVGVNFAGPMLNRAIARNRDGAFHRRLPDVETLIIEEDARYDAVITRHLIWRLADPNAAFTDWFRVLKPGRADTRWRLSACLAGRRGSSPRAARRAGCIAMLVMFRLMRVSRARA